jgi:hypothetical protein
MTPVPPHPIMIDGVEHLAPDYRNENAPRSVAFYALLKGGDLVTDKTYEVQWRARDPKKFDDGAKGVMLLTAEGGCVATGAWEKGSPVHFHPSKMRLIARTPAVKALKYPGWEETPQYPPIANDWGAVDPPRHLVLLKLYNAHPKRYDVHTGEDLVKVYHKDNGKCGEWMIYALTQILDPSFSDDHFFAMALYMLDRMKAPRTPQQNMKMMAAGPQPLCFKPAPPRYFNHASRTHSADP